MKKGKFIVFIILSFIVTVAFAVYQRTTGPTYPKRVSIDIEQKKYKFKLLRSAEIMEDSKRKEPIVNLDFKNDLPLRGEVYFRTYPPLKKDNGDYVDYDTLPLIKYKSVLFANLPNQDKAGKLQYYIKIINTENGEEYFLEKETPITIRFKGMVPSNILVPHIISMFTGLMMSVMCLLSMIFYRANNKIPRLYGFLSFLLITIGGLVLGIFVQFNAFGVYWAGFPYARDLTDNKTLLAVIIWIIALILNIKKYRPIYLIIAVVAMLVIFCIPHSTRGSERNPETGKIEYR